MDKPSIIEDIPEGENIWNIPDNQQKSQNQTQEFPLMCLTLTMSRFDYIVDYPMYELSLRNIPIYTIWERTLDEREGSPHSIHTLFNSEPREVHPYPHETFIYKNNVTT